MPVAAREGALDALAAEWPFEIELIPIKNLFADLSYQRPPYEAFIASAASQFDSALIGALDVAPRPRGRFAVLDGQQRVEILRKVDIHGVWCAVYEQMSVKEEAAFFYRKNKDRRSVHPFYALRARRVAGDKTAKAIFEIVEKTNFKMAAAGGSTGPKGAAAGTIVAIKALEDAYSWGSSMRDECLTVTLRTIRGAFWQRTYMAESEVVRGVARFWQPFSDQEVDRKLLHEVMKAEGPLGYLGRARDKKATSMRRYPQADIIAREIVADYNRVVRGGKSAKLNANLLHKPPSGRDVKKLRELAAAEAAA